MSERRSAPIDSTDASAPSLAVGAAFGPDPVPMDAQDVLTAGFSAGPRVMLIEDDFILRAHMAEL